MTQIKTKKMQQPKSPRLQNKKTKRLQRPESHQIDELAQRVLRNSLPESWVINEHHKDYGKDYLVEVVDSDGNLTGKTFYVQLKGQRTVKYSKDKKHAKFQLESIHARYYSEKVMDIPVFLVLVDTTLEKGWWLFLQKLLKVDRRWETKQSMSIGLPLANGLSSPEELRIAAESAARWIRSRNSNSLPDAALALKEDMMHSDPRFDVSVTYNGTEIMTYLNPIEPVQMQVTFKGESKDIDSKLHDLLGRGLPVKFAPGEIEFEGMPLFSGGADCELVLQTEYREAVALSLRSRRADSTILATVEGIPGTLSGGQSELRCAGRFPNAPIRLSADRIVPSESGSLKFRLEFREWDNRPILLLPYFDQLQPFLESMEETAKIDFEMYLDGNRIFFSNCHSLQIEHSTFIVRLVKCLRKARKIFQHVGKNPTWSFAQFNVDFCDTVETTYALLFEGAEIRNEPHVSFHIDCVRKTFQQEVIDQGRGTAGFLRLTSPLTAKLLGCEIALGDVHHDYTEVHMSVAKNPRPSKSMRNKIRVDVKGTANTQFKLHRAIHCPAGQFNPAPIKLQTEQH